ncbi:flippase [Pontibacter korlensis]|uniref:flippase n=1 Tax=Pontibacter korlensis TaxID=400092 RepID=UPI00061A9EF9|nr:flippase [Pontibacter korlensis]
MRIVDQIKKPLISAGIKKYAHNTAWLFAEQMLRMAAGFFVGLWVARYLGPNHFGIYSYVIAFTSIFAGLAKIGMDEILVRELVNNSEKEDVYLGTAFWLKMFGALVTLVIVAFITFATSSETLTNFFILIVTGGIIFQSFEVLDFYFRSRVQNKYVSISKLSQLFVSSLLKIYFVLMEAELFWFVLIMLIDQIALALSLYVAFWNKKKQKIKAASMFLRHFDSTIARRLLQDSWPIILSSLAIMIYMRIDQVMLKNMVGTHEVGLYSAGVRLSEIWYFIPTIICSSLFPAIINAKKVDESLYQMRLQRLYTILTWIALAIAIPMTFLSDWVVILLYGNDYAQAGNVLMIYVWAGVFVFQGTARGYWLVSENLQRFGLIYTSMATLLNITLNYLLIPKYGGLGAAWATVISYGCSSIVFPLFFRSTRFSSLQLLKSFIWARS